jgi:hypothetical protein
LQEQIQAAYSADFQAMIYRHPFKSHYKKVGFAGQNAADML